MRIERHEDYMRRRSRELDHAEHLKIEVAYLKNQLQPSGTGHIHTAISVLEKRIEYYEVDRSIKSSTID